MKQPDEWSACRTTPKRFRQTHRQDMKNVRGIWVESVEMWWFIRTFDTTFQRLRTQEIVSNRRIVQVMTAATRTAAVANAFDVVSMAQPTKSDNRKIIEISFER